MSPTSKQSVGSWLKSTMLFLVHQVVATEGVIWLTILGSFMLNGLIVRVYEGWSHSAGKEALRLIMTNTPFFPIQIALGAYLGWRLYRFCKHHLMFWVWILPAIALTYAVIAIPTLSPWSQSDETSALSHYFGWGCQAKNHCYDQLTFTQPFFSAVAYSLGALWAARESKAPQRNVGSI
jgi:hypothetical protein